jgi:hypothetical protein
MDKGHRAAVGHDRLATETRPSLRQVGDTSFFPNVLITLLESDPDTSRKAIRRYGRSRFFRPIFLTTNAETAQFLESRIAFEYFPPARLVHDHADAGPWQEYIPEKWEIVRAKWRPRWIVECGLSLERYLTACRLHARV